MRLPLVRPAVLFSVVALTGTILTSPAASAAPMSAAASVSAQGTAPRVDAASRKQTVWLCRPGKPDDPCSGSLTTTYQGGKDRVSTPRTLRPKPVDCFYLYPTVSTQPTTVSNLRIEPEQVTMAHYQASRFSQICKVYAPMYRQITLAGLGGRASEADREIVYASALSGFRSYLRDYNNGRGFILIGHSQGAGLLRRIMAETVDRSPRLRQRMVTAVLAGTSVAVKRGTVRGGDFRHIPGCTRRDQVGCVTSFATFEQDPPDTALFGKLRNRPGTDIPWGPRYEALCTNPAALRGGSGRLTALYPSSPLATVFGSGQQVFFNGDVPTAETPWVSPSYAFSGRCRTVNKARVLMMSPLRGAPQLTPVITPDWGLHLMDINLVLRQLLPMTEAQALAYVAGTGVPGRG